MAYTENEAHLVNAGPLIKISPTSHEKKHLEGRGSWVYIFINYKFN